MRASQLCAVVRQERQPGSIEQTPTTLWIGTLKRYSVGLDTEALEIMGLPPAPQPASATGRFRRASHSVRPTNMIAPRRAAVAHVPSTAEA